jgi:hypothetical protein
MLVVWRPGAGTYICSPQLWVVAIRAAAVIGARVGWGLRQYVLVGVLCVYNSSVVLSWAIPGGRRVAWLTSAFSSKHRYSRPIAMAIRVLRKIAAPQIRLVDNERVENV